MRASWMSMSSKLCPPRKLSATRAPKKAVKEPKSLKSLKSFKSKNVQPAAAPSNDTAVDVSISSPQLDAWFSQLPVVKKGDIFQTWLEEYR